MPTDDLMRRAYTWVEHRPEQGDRFDMAVHVADGRQLVSELIDLVDDLEIQLEDERSAEVRADG